MSQLNVNTIKNRTGTSGPVLSGLSTVSGSLVVSSDATVSGAATVTGALTVGGVLTYEDVTNVDSVGIITARTGVRILVGESLLLQNAAGSAEGSIECDGAGTNTDIRIRTNSTERLRVTHAGLVGIGTDNPSSYSSSTNNLVISETGGNSGLTLHTGTSNSSFLGFTDTGDTNNQGYIGYSHSDNALVFAANSAEAFRVDSSQRLLVNTATTRNNYDNGSVTSNLLHVERTAASGNAGISICANAATAADVGAILYMGRTSATSNGGNTIVADDDLIGRISFQGADGSELVEAACIRVDVDGAPAANDMPGRIEFHTTADGTAGATERMRITSTGRIGINVNNPDSYNSAGNNLVLGDTSNNSGMTIVTSTTNNGHIFFADGTASGAQNRGIIKYEHGNDAMAFNTAETERLRLTSGGDLLVGHGSVISNMKFGGAGDFGSHAEIIGANKGFANGLAILNYDASASIPAILKLATSRNDTAGSNTVVGNSGDNCASIQFMGNDGTRFIDLARIDGVTDSTPGANDMPGRLAFFTTADGASVVTERMRITNGGDLLSLNTDNGIISRSTLSAGTSNTVFIGQNSATSITSGTNAIKIYTNGNIENSNNSYGSLSDQRLKENIVDATSQWDDIKGLQVRKYNFRENTGNETHTQLGLIAQETESVSPGLVQTTPVKEGETVLDADGNQLESIKSINYSVLYMKSVKALQEAMNRIETLETKVAALEGS